MVELTVTVLLRISTMKDELPATAKHECRDTVWSPTGKARGTFIYGGTRRSTSAFAKASADILLAFIHG